MNHNLLYIPQQLFEPIAKFMWNEMYCAIVDKFQSKFQMSNFEAIWMCNSVYIIAMVWALTFSRTIFLYHISALYIIQS